jgi:uncharacterized protein (TIGR03437 family)
VTRLRLALAILCCGSAWGAAPSYSVAGIVSTGSYAAGPFAPNSLVTIFGDHLSTATRGLLASDLVGNLLPTELNSTRVYINRFPAPLFFVSEKQINLLIPGRQGFGQAELQVVRQGQVGPTVIIEVAAAAPALFVNEGYAIATHGDNSVITAEKPARGGELIVIYAAGLGKAKTMPDAGELAPWPSRLPETAGFRVTVGGTTVDPARIVYAGLTPFSAGLYQVNLILPDSLVADPEVRLFVGDAGSPAGVKLVVR